MDQIDMEAFVIKPPSNELLVLAIRYGDMRCECTHSRQADNACYNSRRFTRDLFHCALK